MVLMTEATHREVKDFIVGKSLGRIKVKGVSEGVVAFALEKIRPEVAKPSRCGGERARTERPPRRKGARKGKGAGDGNGMEVFMRLEESLFTPTSASRRRVRIRKTRCRRGSPPPGTFSPPPRHVPGHVEGGRGDRGGLPRGIRLQGLSAEQVGGNPPEAERPPGLSPVMSRPV